MGEGGWGGVWYGVGGKDSRIKTEEMRILQGRERILDVCPAIVMLPNPLLDLGVAGAAETTVGGSEMLRFHLN